VRLRNRVSGILFLFLSAGLQGQFFEYGQDAGTLRWSRFETPHYRVIYPRGIDSLANAFALRLETAYPYLGQALDHEHRRMPVIIHNESSFSNGVFVWAPKRLEIFSNPDPNSYNQDWLWQLALHEGRHAVQIDKLDQGFTRALHYLGGEQLVGAMAVFLPYWYLEGDAVDAETRLSQSGRGRQPSFEMELKAQMLGAGQVYSFSKAVLGSYRNYIPNHYKLGYLMVRHGRRNYGDEFWIDFQQYSARRPFLLNPTYFSMRKYGVKSKRQFYLDAMEEFRNHWALRDSLREKTPYHSWREDGIRHYTNHTFPHEISPSLVMAYKNGIDQIPEFVLLGREGQEQSVFRPGFLSSGRVSFSGSHIVWDEFVPDTRWSNRNFSVIRSYEIATGRIRSLGRRTRYYSPDLSGDGTRIAAIEQSDLQKFSLVILDLKGRLLNRIPSPGNVLIQHPAWMEKDTAIVVVVSEGQSKSLSSFRPADSSWNEVMDAGVENISFPVISGSRIYFSGTFSGIDNIYCHDTGEGRTWQVTSSRFGAFQPSISRKGDVLYYANYTSGGFEVASVPLEEGLWRPLEKSRDHTEQLDHETSEVAYRIREEEALKDTTYIPEPYPKIRHLFNVHSWLPLYVNYLNPVLSIDPDHLPVSPGLSLVSQNHLSTAVSQLGYEYKNGFHYFHSGIQFKGRYPVVNLYFDAGGEPDILVLNDAADTAMALPADIHLRAETYVPLRLNTGKFLTLVQPGIEYSYRRDLQFDEEIYDYEPGVHYLYYTMYGTSYLRQGARDILPRLGITLSGGYYHAPFGNLVYGAASVAGMTVYLPGFLKHHTIRLSGQTQMQYPLDPNRPAFLNLMTLPRGLYSVFGEELTRISADYVFPVLYPDLALSGLLYLKRIRAALWTDYMTGTNVIIRDPQPHYEDRTYHNIGADVIADLNILRIPFPLSLGARFIHELDTRRTFVEFLYTIDFN